MEDMEIIETVLSKIKADDMWFTQKTDPTFGEAPDYYKLDEYGDLKDVSIKQIVKEVKSLIGEGAVGIDDATDLWIQDAMVDNKIAYKDILVTKFKDKPVVDGIEAFENPVQLDESKTRIKQESVKRRLKEENNKSANLITQMMQDKNFDAESNAGKIILRTSALFNALSEKGYDVQVAFDNGESTSAILLGQQGGQVIITINNDVQPLKSFASGNFEINNENVDVLKNIADIVETI